MKVFILTLNGCRFACTAKSKKDAYEFFCSFHDGVQMDAIEEWVESEEVEFCWTWEIVASDQVVVYVDWNGDLPKGYESLTEYAQDHGIPATRQWAKKWAKENGLTFKEDKYSVGGPSGYGAAILAAAHNRAC